MEDLKLFLTEEQYFQLKDIYRTSPLEQIGIMYGNIFNNEIIIHNIQIFNQKSVLSQTVKEVSITGKTLLNAIINAKKNGANVFVSIHTHPSISGIAYLSNKDKESLKEESNFIKKYPLNMLGIEGVITYKGVNFFVWNNDLNDAERIDCYVNGKKEEDAEQKSLIQLFKDGFNEGKYRTKRKIYHEKR